MQNIKKIETLKSRLFAQPGTRKRQQLVIVWHVFLLKTDYKIVEIKYQANVFEIPQIGDSTLNGSAKTILLVCVFQGQLNGDSIISKQE